MRLLGRSVSASTYNHLANSELEGAASPAAPQAAVVSQPSAGLSVRGVLNSIRNTCEGDLSSTRKRSAQSFRQDVTDCYKSASLRERTTMREALFTRSKALTTQRKMARLAAATLSGLFGVIGMPVAIVAIQNGRLKTKVKFFLKSVLTDLARIDYDDGRLQPSSGTCREDITYKDLFEYQLSKR